MRRFAIVAIVLSSAAAALASFSVDPSPAYIPSPLSQGDRITPQGTGFEAPFSLGAINGQQGWSVFTANATGPNVSDLLPFSGVQHMLIQRGAGSSTSLNGAFSPDYGNFANEASTLSVQVLNDALGAQTAQIIGQAPSQAFLSYRVILDISGAIGILDDPDGPGPGALAFIDSGDDWVPGEYRELKIDFRPSIGKIDYYYGGVFIYQGNIFAGTAVEQVILATTNPGVSNVVLYDDYALVPEPASLALLSLAGLLIRRR